MDQLPEHPFLGGLPQSEMNWLEGRLSRVSLVPGQMLTRPEEAPEAVWFLIDSTCSIYAQDPLGRLLGLTMIGAGHVVGAELAMGPQPSSLTAIVERSGDALRLVATGPEISSHAPALFERLGWAVSENVLRLSRVALEMTHASATRRVAAVLEDHYIACEERLIQTTHDHLAQWLAVRRATVTTALQELEEMKAIRSRRGTIELLDPQRLSEIARGGSTVKSGPAPGKIKQEPRTRP